MCEQFERTKMLIGQNNIEHLQNAHIAVFGIGGVGSYTVEALARSGIGSITIVDNDTISPSNINRQLIATHSTVGKLKVDVARKRLLDINPNIKVTALSAFFTADNAGDFDFTKFDYVVDAIDTVSSKLALAECCTRSGTPIISSMGTGNKLDATAFKVSDINKTSMCPLAKVMRRELKARDIKRLKVVYSEEQPLKPLSQPFEETQGRRQTPASIAFVPSVAGLIIAGEVIKDLTK